MNFLIFILHFLISLTAIQSQFFPDHPIANPSTSWINNDSPKNDMFTYMSGIGSEAIIIRRIPNKNMAYSCGFFWVLDCACSFFSVVILEAHNSTNSIDPVIDKKVVWSANRNNPIHFNSTLEFTSDGDLILKDVSGELVWSTNTSGKSVSGLNITEFGNLVLFDVNNSVVWQSFDHPTDTLFPNQAKTGEQKLIGSISGANWTEGSYSYAVTNDGDFFYVGSGSDPREVYYHGESISPIVGTYIQLGFDGHLRRFQLDKDVLDNVGKDVLENELSDCQYPLVCGEYGVCQNGECSSPQSKNSVSAYFRPNDIRKPNLGYTRITDLDCNASEIHSFIKVENVSYFTFSTTISNIDEDSCKKACLGNCSCNAAMFRQGSRSSLEGDCYLPSKVYSLMDINEVNNKMNISSYNLSIYLKVQRLLVEKVSSGESCNHVIMGLAFGALLAIGIVLV